MRPATVIGAAAAVATTAALLGWAGWAAVTWRRYGRTPRPARPDPLLDRFMPTYEVTDSHEARVAAPAAVTYAAAVGMGMQEPRAVRSIIRAREWLMRARGGTSWPPGGIVEQMWRSGWAVLTQEQGRAVALGAVTQPWQGDVTFRGLPPDEFRTFDRAGYVRILTTIEVEPVGPAASVLRLGTRVATTDATARARFRRYWAVFSPGILLIRYALLRRAKREAERRHRLHRRTAMRARAPGAPAVASLPSVPAR